MAVARRDYAFPFRIDLSSQQTALAGYQAHVDQMVRQLLLTSPGERAGLPQFGCGLRSLIFAPDGDALAATVRLRVIQGLSQWLAGIVTVADVTVGGPAAGTADGAAGRAVSGPGTLTVTVTYTLAETQATQAVTVTVR